MSSVSSVRRSPGHAERRPVVSGLDRPAGERIWTQIRERNRHIVVPRGLKIAGVQIVRRFRTTGSPHVDPDDGVAAQDAQRVGGTSRVADHTPEPQLERRAGDGARLAGREHEAHVDWTVGRAGGVGPARGEREQTNEWKNGWTKTHGPISIAPRGG